MRNKPYAGMGNVSKTEGLCSKEKKKDKKTYHAFISRIKKGYATVPNELLFDPNITTPAKACYAIIDAFASADEGMTFRGYETIGKCMTVVSSRISQLVKELVKKGWATSIRRGLNRTNITKLHSYRGEKVNNKKRKQLIAEVEAKIHIYRIGL